ncbi:MAG TPA: hypothetical protein VE959_05150, partial [Bryobacteraceae bacterium]|nr:hypothetical protein [Bryobacteraceae bacterium]
MRLDAAGDKKSVPMSGRRRACARDGAERFGKPGELRSPGGLTTTPVQDDFVALAEILLSSDLGLPRTDLSPKDFRHESSMQHFRAAVA